MFIPIINLLNSLKYRYEILKEKDHIIENNKIPMSEKDIKEFKSFNKCFILYLCIWKILMKKI